MIGAQQAIQSSMGSPGRQGGTRFWGPWQTVASVLSLECAPLYQHYTKLLTQVLGVSRGPSLVGQALHQCGLGCHIGPCVFFWGGHAGEWINCCCFQHLHWL